MQGALCVEVLGCQAGAQTSRNGCPLVDEPATHQGLRVGRLCVRRGGGRPPAKSREHAILPDRSAVPPHCLNGGPHSGRRGAQASWSGYGGAHRNHEGQRLLNRDLAGGGSLCSGWSCEYTWSHLAGAGCWDKPRPAAQGAQCPPGGGLWVAGQWEVHRAPSSLPGPASCGLCAQRASDVSELCLHLGTKPSPRLTEPLTLF